MRILFMGTTVFSTVVLKQLLDDDYHVVGVITQPDRKVGRKQVLKAPIVKEMALTYDLTILQPERISTAYEDIKALKPDVILTCAYGQIVPKKILELPTFISLNVHASILPKYRGGAPIHKAIINGENKTGVTLMEMTPKMDAGDMFSKRFVTIENDDTFGDVEAKLMDVSKELIHEDLPKVLSKELLGIPQDEKEVTFAYAIKREEEFISFNQEVHTIYNHIRGLIPWPVGYGTLNNINIKIHGAKMEIKAHNKPFGTIYKMDEEGIHVAVKNGIIILTKSQPQGKPIMSNLDLVNGYSKTWIGARFL